LRIAAISGDAGADITGVAMGDGAAGDLVAVCANAVGMTAKSAAASADAALRFKALEWFECMSSFSTKGLRGV